MQPAIQHPDDQPIAETTTTRNQSGSHDLGKNYAPRQGASAPSTKNTWYDLCIILAPAVTIWL